MRCSTCPKAVRNVWIVPYVQRSLCPKVKQDEIEPDFKVSNLT